MNSFELLTDDLPTRKMEQKGMGLDFPTQHRYFAIEKIGHGSLGQVFKARRDLDDRVVAVKSLHLHLTNKDQYREIFNREVLTTAGLSHPNLIRFLDCNLEIKNCFMVSEFVEGWTLQDLQRMVGRLPPLVACAIIFKVVEAIDYLHLVDIVHSDLTSSNILICRSGRVVLSDLGLAAHRNIESHENFRVGTAGYYSPEHISAAAVTPQSDIYCLGLILYELIVGMKAVRAHKNVKIVQNDMRRIQFGQIPCTNPELLHLIRALLENSLELSSKKRIKRSGEVLSYLGGLLRNYKVNNPQKAILQFLKDANLGSEQPTLEQDIYLGNQVYGPWDLKLFSTKVES